MTNINKDKDKDKVWTEKDSIEAEIIQIADLLGFNEEKKIIEKENKIIDQMDTQTKTQEKIPEILYERRKYKRKKKKKGKKN